MSDEADTIIGENPFALFDQWFAEAKRAEPNDPDAVALATATPDAAPSLRMVLLKGFDARGLVFFSHYTSRKGRELEANPRAALLFYWSPFGRQVRVEGDAVRLGEEESDAYFATRPRGAQLGALASRQSEPLESREELEQRLAELAGTTPTRPATWGGYLVVPDAWEFWQHRDSRLHDRFRYESEPGGGWTLSRLYP